MNKEDGYKEKFKQALISTVKVISEDYKIEKDEHKNFSSKNYNFFELDALNSKEDYIKLRAETDSEALKRKFSNNNIYQKNSPSNSSCKLLYNISEKIRYEVLGTKMLKGISRNLKNNYSFKILNKKKDHIKSKEDVEISEAFELYMLKNFMEIKLDSLSEKTLSYWEKDFNNSFKNHGLFQTYYSAHHLGGDRNARDQFKDHKYYQATVDFCEKYDQSSFDPNYKSMSLEDFSPMVERIFARSPYYFV